MVQEQDEYILKDKTFEGGKEVSNFLGTSKAFLEHNFASHFKFDLTICNILYNSPFT